MSERQPTDLENLVGAHRTGQAVARRARVVLLAAIGYSNMDIARLGPMNEEAVSLWGRRWAGLRAIPIDEMSVVDRLTDAPRPGVQPRLTAKQVCQIVALACEQPSGSGPTHQPMEPPELADKIVRRGITDRISPRHTARLLKSGRPQPH